MDGRNCGKGASRSLQLKPTGLGKKGVVAALSAIPGFSPSHLVLKAPPDGVALDVVTRMAVLIKSGNLILKPFDDLVSSEIIIDGQTVTKHHLGSQLTRAAVGGLVAGGVGALIGGMGSKETTRQVVRDVRLRVRVNDFQYPIHELSLIELTWYGQTRPEAAELEARKFHNLLCVIAAQRLLNTVTPVDSAPVILSER